MPRRKLCDAPSTKTRTCTGCRPCRSRKIKCDEAKPACRNCTKRGLVCGKGLQLKWASDYTSRGLAFGREGIWGKHRVNKRGNAEASVHDSTAGWHLVPTIGPYYFVDTSAGDFLGVHIVDEISQTGDEPSVAELSAETNYICLANKVFPRTKEPSLLPNLSGTQEMQILDFYLQRLVPLTTPSEADGSRDLLLAVLAFAARHRSQTDGSWSQIAKRLKGNVLSTLRTAVRANSVAPAALYSRILAIMMFMCLYEINDDCDRSWVVHLRGSREIIRQHRRHGSPLVQSESDPAASFTERFFAFQDVIGRTACGDVPLFGSDFWQTQSQTEVDAWMGCSPQLAKVICYITELSRNKSREDDHASWECFARKASALANDLESLQQDVPSSDGLLAKSAELKRLSTILYLHCALYGASPSTPIVARLVRIILQHVRHFLHMGRFASLGFALFVAGVELDPLKDVVFVDHASGRAVCGRKLILTTLNAMTGSSVSSVHRMRAVVQKVWRMRDLHLQEDDERKSIKEDRAPGSVQNDWEYFVAPVSANVSLA